MDLEFLYAIPSYLVYVALAAWALAFVGLVRALARAVSARRGSPSPDDA